eukprot:499811_1
MTSKKRLLCIINHLDNKHANKSVQSNANNNIFNGFQNKEHAQSIVSEYMTDLNELCHGTTLATTVADKWIADNYFSYEGDSSTMGKQQWINNVSSVVSVIKSFDGNVSVTKFSKNCVLYSFV